MLALKMALASVAVLLSAGVAQANTPVESGADLQEARPLWVCGLTFEGQSEGIQFIFGVFHTEADGEIRCTDAIGGTFVQPVRITMGSLPVAPGIGFGYFEFAGASAQFSLLTGEPSQLLGSYLVTQAQVAVGLGASVFTAIHPGLPLSLQISMQVLSGAGVHVGIRDMTIEAL